MQVSRLSLTWEYVATFTKIFSFALLLVYGKPAGASTHCPGKGDIGKPILLGNTNPFYASVFKHRPEFISEQKLSFNGKKLEDVSTTYFNALLARSRIQNGVALNFEYKENTDNIGLLHDKKTWNSELTLLDGTNVLDLGVINLTFIGRQPIGVGACQFDTSVYRETIWLQTRGKIVFIKYYADDIDLVVRATHIDADGAVINDTVYDRIEIADTY